MSQQEYSGRPRQRLDLTVVFGIGATRAYADGQRDRSELNKAGRIKTFNFNTLEELNAFVLGVDEATGYQDTIVVDEDH